MQCNAALNQTKPIISSFAYIKQQQQQQTVDFVVLRFLYSLFEWQNEEKTQRKHKQC